MRVLTLFLFGAALLCAQAPPAPDQAVATVNGKPVTAADVRRMLTGAPPLVRTNAQQDPKEFLRWVYLSQQLAADAEKIGLDKKSPYAEELAWSHQSVLMTAEMDEQARKIPLAESDLRDYYDKHLYLFGSAKVKLLYVASNSDGGPAKAKALAFAKQARAGADFGRLAKTSSDDQDSAAKNGDFATVNKDSRIPVEMKQAIFSLKPGEITDPLYREGGYYIFQVTSKELPSFDEIKGQLSEIVKDARLQEWMDGLRAKAEVKTDNKAYFQTVMFRALGVPGAANPQPNEPKPEDVVAHVNGQPMTVADFEGLIRGMPPKVRENAVRDPEEFLRTFAVMKQIVDLGAADKLDQRPTQAIVLRYNRLQFLTQARADDYLREITVLPDEQHKAYEDRGEEFRFATVRVLKVNFNVSPPPGSNLLTEEQARQKMDDIAKQLREGGDFVKMVTQFSDDADTRTNGGKTPVLRASDPQVPPDVKKAIFSAKAGDLVGPMKINTDFWLFRVDELGKQAFEEVKDTLIDQIRNERFQKWFDGLRTSFDVQITDPQAFRQIAIE